MNGTSRSPSPAPWERGQADKGTTPEFNRLALTPNCSNLIPLAPLSVNGEGGTSASHTHGSPSLFTERGLGGEVGEASEIAAAFPQVEAKPCTLIRRGQGGEGWKNATLRFTTELSRYTLIREEAWGEGEITECFVTSENPNSIRLER